MEWTINRLEKGNIISMKTFGPADWDQNKKMCEEAFSLAQKHGSHRFLVDHRKLEHGLSILEVDDIPVMLKEIGVTSEDKVAIVFNPKSPLSNTFKFFGDAAFIAFLQLRIFSDKAEAIEWLKTENEDKKPAKNNNIKSADIFHLKQ
jgi:hypothetical protein